MLCQLAAGKTLRPAENLAGGIVGTGLGFGFFRTPDLVIVLEDADFDKFTPSSVGKKLTALFGSPFGKETNGASLFKHFNAHIERTGLQYPMLTSTKELDEVARAQTPLISSIAQGYLNRSAQFVATHVLQPELFGSGLHC